MESPESVAGRMANLQSLPDAFVRVDAAVGNPTSSANDIADAITADQGMTTRVLKLANSSLYAFPSRVETVSQAVTIIGTRQIRDLALATAVVDLFGSIECEAISSRDFWLGAFSCGCLARGLALRRREPNAERHFVAGLLSSVGRLALFSELPSEAQAVVADNERGVLAHLAERERIGFDQGQLAAALITRWGLPRALADTMRYQYGEFGKATQPVEPAIVHVASFLLTAGSIGNFGERWVLPLDPSLLSVDVEGLELLVADAEESAADLVELIGGGA
jgi:HD-like signal output (HDOD) protein